MFWNLRKKHRNEKKESFGTISSACDREQMRARMDHIAIYHNEMEEAENSCLVDNVTWDDLEMDEVFFRINHTGSYIGEQILYRQLHMKNKDGETWEELERQILFYREHEKERVDLEEELSWIGKKEEDYYMPQFLMHPELWHIQNGLLLRVLQILLCVYVAGTVCTRKDVWIAGLLVVAIVNLMVYIFVKRKYEIFLYSLGSLRQLLHVCQKMINARSQKEFPVPPDVVRITKEMKGLSRKIIGWQTRKYVAFSGDILYLMQDYLFGITLLDISMFNRIMKRMDEKQDQIMRLYEFVGQIDMGISITSFRASLPCYCLPEIRPCDLISAKRLIHPLITDAVENDFVLNRRALITGANASGKSTFMKALAINVILAQTIHTCTASHFLMPRLRVVTSMALRDHVMTGESFYMREAKRMKEMVEEEGDPCPKLLVLDEMFKGTNTKERLAVSAAVLDYVAGTSDFVLVATHDMELVKDMGTKYDNYYFDSIITDTDIIFEYQIFQGQGGKSNAIGLLSLLDYPGEVIVSAKKRMKRI